MSKPFLIVTGCDQIHVPHNLLTSAMLTPGRFHGPFRNKQNKTVKLSKPHFPHLNIFTKKLRFLLHISVSAKVRQRTEDYHTSFEPERHTRILDL